MPEESAQLTAPDMPSDGQVDSTPSDQQGQAEDTQADEVGQANSTDTSVNDAPGEESFTTSVNPNELPDELKGVYNSMLKDYRTKTAAAAAEIKAAEADRRQAQEILNDPVIQKLLKGEPLQEESPKAPVSGEDLLLQILENPTKLQELIREEAEKLNQPLVEDLTTRQVTNLVENFYSKYPDAKQYEDEISAEFSEIFADGKDPATTLVRAYKNVMFDKVQNESVKHSKVAARDSIAQPQASSAPTVPTAPEVRSIHDAFRLAKEQHQG